MQFSSSKDTQIPIVYHPEDDEPTLLDTVMSMPVDVNKGGNYVPTLLTAAYVGDLQAVRVSGKEGWGFRWFYSTPITNPSPPLQTLIAHGANLDMRNRNGWTPLMYACQRGNKEVCRMLLDKGANPDLRNSKGRTALMLAASWGHAKTVSEEVEVEGLVVLDLT